MDFSLTDDQTMLKETASRFFEREYDFQAHLKAEGHDSALWRQLAELGLVGALLPETAGGFGGSIETMIVMEEGGRRLLSEPLVSCGVIAGTLLAADRSAKRDDRLDLLVGGDSRPVLATMEAGMRHPYDHAAVALSAVRDGDGWRLSGAKRFVLDGGAATAFLVTAKIDGELSVLFVPADAAGLDVRAYRTIDGRSIAELGFADVAVGGDALLDLEDAGAAIDRALDAGIAAWCAEAVGSMDHLLQTTIAYTQQREQYGAPLASYQALQHRMVDMFVELEMARSMSFLAASATRDDAAERAAAISAARVQVAQSGRFVGREAVQLHGAIGMSEELDVAHHFKRLTLLSQLMGDNSHHLRRFAAADVKPD